jgi:hypothetical protein
MAHSSIVDCADLQGNVPRRPETSQDVPVHLRLEPSGPRQTPAAKGFSRRSWECGDDFSTFCA